MVRLSEVKGIPVAFVVGDLDIANAADVFASLKAAADGKKKFIVSLEQCTYGGSHAITTLMRLYRHVGGGLIIVSPANSQFRRVLSIAGVDSVLPIVDTVDAALNGKHPKSKP